MAVKFNTSTLKDNEYATYNLEKFNGVDYTDTPTSVDDSRAVDISNYLPEGNSLFKRHGWENLGYPFANEYNIANIFKFKDKYVFLGRDKQYPTVCALFMADDLEYTNGKMLNTGPAMPSFTMANIAEDYNGWAVEKDGRLFVFTGTKYLMIYYDTLDYLFNGFTREITDYWVKEVSNFAYVPTIAIGVQDNSSYAQTQYSYEELNMLSNQAYVEFWFDFSNGTFSFINGSYYWTKSGYFDLNDLFPNLDNFALQAVGNTPISSLRVAQTDYYSIQLAKENGEPDEIRILFKLDGKQLKYEVHTTTSVSYSFSNENETNINNVNFYKKQYEDNNETILGNKRVKMKFSFDNSNAITTINKMRFGILYGANNYKDTLFATGNPDYPNMDVHTCAPKEQGLDDWVTYTYFGDMSYHKIGSSSSAIIGYGINSDSSLTIIKQSLTNEPNVYIRTATYKIETKTIELSKNVASIKYEDAYVLYQVFPSAINIKCDKREQVVQFDNKVLINGKYGIYYVNINSSTAESSYDGVEASYFIRGDLTNDISTSCITEYNEKLYVMRMSKSGKKRIYVCDKNRYSYHNSKLIYEWWVLDDVPADKLYVFEDNLYFTKNGRLYKFTENFYDLDKYTFSSISVGDDSDEFVTDLFFDYSMNEMIITSSNEFIQSCKNSSTPKEDYEDFRDKTTVSLGKKIYWVLDTLVSLNLDGLILGPSATNEEINTILYFLQQNDYKLYRDGEEFYVGDNWEYVYENDKLIGITFNDLAVATGNTIVDTDSAGLMIPIASGTKFQLSSLNDGEHDIKDCMYKEATWTYITDGVYTELGTNVVFNHFKLAYNGVEIDFALDSNFIPSAKLEFKKPVKSLWVSNYNHLGKLDFLKTATNIYFVPDARRGGYTHVGYRTYKKDVGFYTNSKGEGFSFSDINFDDFTFSQEQFGRTYSSKKKIKNFSFIQLKFYSLEETDSTLVMCTFRYKYSKNNKGVK